MAARISFSILFFILIYFGFGQQLITPSPGEILSLPEWAKEMYSQNPNVLKVDMLYKEFYSSHPFEKTTHTQQYKHWRKRVGPYINSNGFIEKPDEQELNEQNKLYETKIAGSLNIQGKTNVMPGTWQSMGAMRVYDPNGPQIASQANVHCIDESPSSPNVLYCGGETGEIYKSTNSGTTWTCVTMNYDFQYGGIDAIEIDPTDPNIVYAGCYKLWKTTDGGLTWNVILNVPNMNANEILVNPGNTQVVLAACDAGLYRSTNAGATWTQLFSDKSYDVKTNAANPNIIYLVKNNPVLIKEEFFISNDMGATWTVQTNGWYNSVDPNRTDRGAHIGVSPANPNRIYAYLIGESKLNDNGFIGLYRSDNGGVTWYLPNTPVGGPYSFSHQNLASSQNMSGYHQGFYNSALMVSKTNADSILIGGINCWRSNNGGYNYVAVGGNFGTLPMHVDMQDFRAGASGYWVTCDGGIYFSPDFFTSTNPVKTRGIRGQDFWGFGSGWNEDILIGGTYHNGILAYYQNYNPGDFLCVTGGEPATGYVNPCLTRQAYGEYMGSAILPSTIAGGITFNSWGMLPNENYWPGGSSEVEFHPNCYNTNFLGNKNNLWKSTDNGVTYNLLKAFGSNTNAPVQHFEISKSKPNVMYVTQAPAAGSIGTLWKTTDAGATWTMLAIPGGNSYAMYLAVNPVNENILWMAYQNGTNGNKIYKSTNGGLSWVNITTPMLDNEKVHSILHYGGTDGGIYYCTDNTIYYRNNSMPDWVIYNTGLPLYFNTNQCRPFYKNGRIRSASYGKGIWENILYEAPSGPVAQISVDKLNYQVVCTNDSFYFKDYSMLNNTGAVWQWTFQGGSPATSTMSNQNVLFSGPGTWLVTLKVTDANLVFSIDSLYITITQPAVPNTISEGFQAITFPPPAWVSYDQLNDGAWALTNTAGGYGTSSQCAWFDNYNIDSQGSSDDMRFMLDLSLGGGQPKLKFDVAHARYDNTSNDMLKVMASNNCGQTFTQLYSKSGAALATAPDIASPFIPTSVQWRTDSVDLSAYTGQSNVLIAIRNVGNWGNNIYVDNVNLNGIILNNNVLKQDLNELVLFPNPASAGGNIFIASDKNENFEIKLFDINGKMVMDKKVSAGKEIQLPLTLTRGTYFYYVVGETITKKGKLLVAERK